MYTYMWIHIHILLNTYDSILLNWNLIYYRGTKDQAEGRGAWFQDSSDSWWALGYTLSLPCVLSQGTSQAANWPCLCLKSTGCVYNWCFLYPFMSLYYPLITSYGLVVGRCSRCFLKKMLLCTSKLGIEVYSVIMCELYMNKFFISPNLSFHT